MPSFPVIVLFALLGAPLFAVFAANALFGFHDSGMGISNVILEINRLVDTPVLVTIPLFTFAGYLMSESGTSRRLVVLSRALFGWMPGGLAIVTLCACSMFTAFTGASGVTIIAIGAILYPALTSEGYPENFSLGLITCAGSLGLLFPPSVPLILYGIITKTSVDKMFTAGVLPGVLMLVLLGIYSVYVAVKHKVPLQKFDFSILLQAMREAAWEIPLPILVVGGIYTGWFAVSEAAAVTAVYATIAEVFIYREISLSSLFCIVRRSMTLVGGILIIVGVSLASTNYLIDREVPMKLFELVQTYVAGKWTFLIILNVFLLILGCLLDIFSATVLVVPLLLPVAQGFGINPVHLGIVFLANMQIGYCTPPVGMNLFISSYRFKKSLITLTYASLPFLAVLLLTVLIITYMPSLSLLFVGG